MDELQTLLTNHGLWIVALVFDLRNSAQIESDGARIPGAQQLRADELDTRHKEIPRDREIILYCT